MRAKKLPVKVYQTLTPSQQDAAKIFFRFLADPVEKEMVLTGYAGCGKTFLLGKLLDLYPEQTIIACTISHSAKDVLQANMPEHVLCKTLASALNMRQKFIHGVETFVPIHGSKAPPAYEASILVVDECSMLDEKLMDYIRDAVNENCKIIYSGDRAQLPPVISEDVSTFRRNNLKKPISASFDAPVKANLIEVVRYGALIGKLGQYYRDMIEYVEKGGNADAALHSVLSFYPQWGDGNESVTFTTDSQWFLENAIHDFQNDTLNTRIIAYKNETIDTNNEVIRPYFFDPYTKYSVGEYMVLNRPYQSPNTHLYNGTVIRIIRAEEDYHDFSVNHPEDLNEVGEKVPVNLKVWRLVVKRIDPVTRAEVEDEDHEIVAIHQDSEEEFEEIQQSIIRITKETNTPSMWGDLSKLRSESLFAGRYYCMSAYKSQGQGITNVYYMFRDTVGVETIDALTKLRTTYVACTRSKKKLVVLI